MFSVFNIIQSYNFRTVFHGICFGFFLDLDPDSGRRKKMSESVSGLKDPDTKHFFNIGSVCKYFVDLCDIVDVIVVVLSLISVVEPKTER